MLVLFMFVLSSRNVILSSSIENMLDVPISFPISVGHLSYDAICLCPQGTFSLIIEALHTDSKDDLSIGRIKIHCPTAVWLYVV